MLENAPAIPQVYNPNPPERARDVCIKNNKDKNQTKTGNIHSQQKQI